MHTHYNKHYWYRLSYPCAILSLFIPLPSFSEVTTILNFKFTIPFLAFSSFIIVSKQYVLQLAFLVCLFKREILYILVICFLFNILNIHPCCLHVAGVNFYWWVIFHHMINPQFIYPFHQSLLRLFWALVFAITQNTL